MPYTLPAEDVAQLEDLIACAGPDAVTLPQLQLWQTACRHLMTWPGPVRMQWSSRAVLTEMCQIVRLDSPATVADLPAWQTAARDTLAEAEVADEPVPPAEPRTKKVKS